MKKLIQLKRYADIVWFKTYANLKGEHEKTYLGCLWWMLEPILNTALFYLVFVEILKNRTEGFVAFLYTGMVIYGWFSGGVNLGAQSVIAHATLMQQVRLPKMLFPFISVSNVSWKFLFSLGVLFPLLWMSHAPPSTAYLLLPPLFLLQYLAIVCISMPLAALIPYFQDGRTVLNTALSSGMWFSGVFYSSSQVPQGLRFWYELNPAVGFIESFRAILLHGQLPPWGMLAKAIATAAAFGIAGIWLLHHLDRRVTKLSM